MDIHRIYSWLSPHFRKRRLLRFKERLRPDSNDRLLDVGGYPWCWPAGTVSSAITLLNRSFGPGLADQYPGFTYEVGDGCALPYQHGAFDVVFSNSVVEHLGTWENQLRFAAEARRVGRKLWVQTPARSFFIEPHLLAPFIHWLPLRWQRRLMRRFTPWGWLTRAKPADVDAFLAEVRLLTKAEMQRLFPDCEILEEKFLGMTKSYVAVRRA